VGRDRASGGDVVQAGGDVGVGVEAEHRVGLWQRVGELAAVAFGEAAHGDNLLSGVGSREQRVDRILLGGVDEAAGVHDHDVGVAGLLGE